MAFSKQFENELNKLFHQRTHWLRSELGYKKIGKPPEFDRKKVNIGINKLQQIASDSLARKLAKTEFNRFISHKKDYHIKGYGPEDKKIRFEKWLSKYFMNSRGLAYAFWGKNRKCIYVGRTGTHGSRPSSHFKIFWFSSVKRVSIFSISSKSQIPKLECLAIHHFLPARNKNKAATRKWTKACPLCEIHKNIENELRSIFRFKR